MRILIFPLMATAMFLGGCATTCIAGPDINMVVFQSAVNTQTGMSIPEVRITAATINGEDTLKEGYGGLYLLRSGINGGVKNIRAENGQVICDVQCSFGPPGTYVLTVAADGYQPQELRFTIASRAKGTVLGIQFGCGGVTTGTPRSFQLKFVPK